MKVERKLITDEAEWLRWRAQDVTASVIACLWGLHPFETVYGLAARVRGMQLSEPKSSKILQRGREFQEIVARYMRHDHPTWKIRAAKHYLRAPDLRLGATPDFYCDAPEQGRGIIEAKSVASLEFKRSWANGVPLWISLQALTCAMLARARFAIVAAIVIDPWHWPPEVHEFLVPRHKAAEQRLLDTVAAFWAAIDRGEMPNPDFSRDARLIAAMHPNVTPGKILDLTNDNRLPELLVEREKIKAKISELRELEKQCKTLDAEIFNKIGDAEYVQCADGWQVISKLINKRGFTVEATSYRQLTATHQEKGDANESEAAA